MIDMRQTIIAKSDQLNSDDLIGGAITVKITKVSLAAGEQPIAISYDGDNGKPYMPCKSMRRVLVNVWGSDGNAYVGKSLTLYRDEKVRFGGMDVGGIRISHMSDIDKPVTMSLTAAKASKKAYTVQPLGEVKTPAAPTPEQQKAVAKKKADSIIATIKKANSHPAINDILVAEKAALERFANSYSELESAVYAAKEQRIVELLKAETQDDEMPI